MFDAKANAVLMNPATLVLFGFENAAEMTGNNALESLLPQDRERFLKVIQQVMEIGLVKDAQFTLLKKDGTSFEAELSCSALYDLDEKPRGLVSVTRNITERKQAELELLNTKEALEKANFNLQTALIREQELSRTDLLTGINNRRHLFELAEQTIAVAIRYKQPLAAMMFDIDHFKQVNDVFGHDIGDRILEGVTQCAVAELRTGDVIGRYGGEEFIILLPMTIALQAYPLAERIRISVANLAVASEKGNVSVTLSIGIVEMLPDAQTETVEDLFRRADKAMYGAKFTGRNRTVIIE